MQVEAENGCLSFARRVDVCVALGRRLGKNVALRVAMSNNIRRRIAKLEAALPREIVLTLDDGTTFHHPGPALRFCVEGMDQIGTGRGPIADAVCRTGRAEGCGLLWQLLSSLSDSASNDP